MLGLNLCAASEALCGTADNNLGADATIALTSGYGGTGHNTQWVQDPDVGIVVECSKVLILLHPTLEALSTSPLNGPSTICDQLTLCA